VAGRDEQLLDPPAVRVGLDGDEADGLAAVMGDVHLCPSQDRGGAAAAPAALAGDGAGGERVEQWQLVAPGRLDEERLRLALDNGVPLSAAADRWRGRTTTNVDCRWTISSNSGRSCPGSTTNWSGSRAIRS
jgi:hypothetical protein